MYSPFLDSPFTIETWEKVFFTNSVQHKWVIDNTMIILWVKYSFTLHSVVLKQLKNLDFGTNIVSFSHFYQFQSKWSVSSVAICRNWKSRHKFNSEKLQFEFSGFMDGYFWSLMHSLEKPFLLLSEFKNKRKIFLKKLLMERNSAVIFKTEQLFSQVNASHFPKLFELCVDISVLHCSFSRGGSGANNQLH